MFAADRTHGSRSFLSFRYLSWFFLNRQQGDRAIPPKICDIPLPIARPVSAAWHLAAFRARVRNGDAGAAPLFLARANVLRQPAMTSRVVAPDGSRIYRHSRDARGCAGASDRPGRRTCGSKFSIYI